MTTIWIMVDGVRRELPIEDVNTPVIAQPLPQPPVWTPLEFLEEFTYEERVALRQFARSDLQAEDWLDLLRASTEVRADDMRTVGGLAYMVEKGVITQARVDAILNVT